MILYSHRKGGIEMMNWYENPEIHAEDFEDLLDLLAEDGEG